jgi:hypothetical protein
MYAVKITDQYQLDSWAPVIDGFDWAWQNDMQVINMSFGGPDEPPDAVRSEHTARGLSWWPVPVSPETGGWRTAFIIPLTTTR